MPYLNDIKLVTNLAVVPELALTKSGREYCNFMVRLVYKNEHNEPMSDYIQITAYDYSAEMLVRDCKKGDLLMITGYLSQIKWSAPGNTSGKMNSKVVVVANCVERLALANGEMPPVRTDQMAMSNYDPVAFDDGEDYYVSSIVMQKNMKQSGSYQQSHYAMYPQPLPNGQWKMPMGKTNARVKAWQQNHNMNNNTQVAGDEISRTPPKGTPVMPPLAPLPQLPESSIDNPKVLQNLLSYNGKPIDDATMKKAKTLIPDNLRVKNDWVRLPNGSSVKYHNYCNIIKSQDEMIRKMSDEERGKLLFVARTCFHLDIDLDKYRLLEEAERCVAGGPPSADQHGPVKIMPRSTDNFNGMKNDMRFTANNANKCDTHATTANYPVPQNNVSTAPSSSSSRVPISGSSPDDWYQDEHGNWQRKR